jgi:hypothetical protein
MPEILFHYERVNPTSWAYLSSLLTLALFFKFNRVWSLRNLDLLLLILLAPGLLLVQYAWENAGYADNAPAIEHLGFLWLFAVGGLLLFRLLLDPAIVRRPLLEPNLNEAGLLFLGGSLLFFLMANIVTGKPSPDDLSPARQVQALSSEHSDQQQFDTFTTEGPGFWLIYRLPRITTQKVIHAAPAQGEQTPEQLVEQEIMVRQATTRVVAILSHLMIVLGLLVIGYIHFSNLTAGIACATLYLMLPYTALWTGSVEHALPASLLVWAIVLYRRPLPAGMMIGLACGTIYYPLFLLPLWTSFYWERGLKRFLTGVLILIGILVLTLAITSPDLDRFVEHLMQMFGVRLPTTENLQGIWQFWRPVGRLPILALFIALAFGFAIWPARKNLGTLISSTAALMLGTQFWHAHGGGIYIAWYLPLLLLSIFRPNLENHVAAAMLHQGWRPWRREVGAQG